MDIKWFNDKTKNIVATLTSKNITINKVGVQFFDTAKEVMLGYSKEKQVLILKPLTRDEIIRGDIPDHTRYNVSISSSYVRISNKAFLQKISDIFNLDLNTKGIKYKAKWRLKINALEVSLGEVV